jgi:hypothetical protein
VGKIVPSQLGRRLEDGRKWAIECAEFFSGARPPSPRLVNPEIPGSLVKQPFVAQESQLVPRRHTDSVLRCQQLMIPGYQGDSMIIRWKK